MGWKRFILTLLAVVSIHGYAAAGPDTKDALGHLKFGKCRIVSFIPTSMRSAKAGLELETRNDTSAFRLQDVKITVYRSGQPFVEGVCGEVSVPKGTSKVRVSGEFDLCDEVSAWSALMAIRDSDLSDFTGDLSMTVVSQKGRKIAYSQKNLSMDSFGGRLTDRKTSETVASVDGNAKTGVEEISVPETGTKPSLKTADKPSSQKANKTKKTRKRRWWQFWKK